MRFGHRSKFNAIRYCETCRHSYGLHQGPGGECTSPLCQCQKFKRGWDSGAELARWRVLELLQAQGKIRKLQNHTRWTLRPKEGPFRAECYESDADYEELWLDAKWHRIVEDTKGMRTATYKRKKKLMLAVHGIEIREVSMKARRR